MGRDLVLLDRLAQRLDLGLRSAVLLAHCGQARIVARHQVGAVLRRQRLLAHRTERSLYPLQLLQLLAQQIALGLECGQCLLTRGQRHLLRLDARAHRALLDLDFRHPRQLLEQHPPPLGHACQRLLLCLHRGLGISHARLLPPRRLQLCI